MSFDPDANKQATEVPFSGKTYFYDHPKLIFSGNHVQQCSSQKHLGLLWDNYFYFNKHLDEKVNNCNNIIWVMKNLSLPVTTKVESTKSDS